MSRSPNPGRRPSRPTRAGGAYLSDKWTFQEELSLDKVLLTVLETDLPVVTEDETDDQLSGPHRATGSDPERPSQNERGVRG